MIVDITTGIMCGGFHYDVDMSEEAHRKLVGNNNAGECDCRYHVISIDFHEAEDNISKTFIHEIIEAVNYIYCNDKLEHERIQQLSFGIHQAMESLGVRFGGKK